MARQGSARSIYLISSISRKVFLAIAHKVNDAAIFPFGANTDASIFLHCRSTGTSNETARLHIRRIYGQCGGGMLPSLCHRVNMDYQWETSILRLINYSAGLRTARLASIRGRKKRSF
jgi:hypothetical protein